MKREELGESPECQCPKASKLAKRNQVLGQRKEGKV